MLTEKEVSIVKALVEEETSKASGICGNSLDNLVAQYVNTLSGIVLKLNRIENSYRYVHCHK